ncbi:hypothetical protein FB556_1743 [Enteractinococcus coprophilus]|uniref:Uncharacterized protein n=1 Tax=Enteractinococcus coprophilus TaxID=1027633 RepID=A0A543AFC7_9MICC|nr:hypothetical protein FB556_1743 [Enteractinococcus coprophilus]
MKLRFTKANGIHRNPKNMGAKSMMNAWLYIVISSMVVLMA